MLTSTPFSSRFLVSVACNGAHCPPRLTVGQLRYKSGTCVCTDGNPTNDGGNPVALAFRLRVTAVRLANLCPTAALLPSRMRRRRSS